MQKKGLFHWVYCPTVCDLCGVRAVLAGSLCDDCLADLPRIKQCCATCGRCLPVDSEYCGKCHIGEKKKGGLSFNTRALMVAGVPIYPDPYCPEGTVYFLNTNYLSLYIHEQGSFVFTGFESTLPNWQIGYVGAVLMIAELVNVKPKSMTVVSGYNYLSL